MEWDSGCRLSGPANGPTVRLSSISPMEEAPVRMDQWIDRWTAVDQGPQKKCTPALVQVKHSERGECSAGLGRA